MLQEVCADTYGIIIYQEQVQRAANVLAGYSLGQADLLRRAMGKKDAEKMAKESASSSSRAAGGVNNIEAKTANAIFDFLENSRNTASTNRTPRPTGSSATRPRI